MANRLLRPRQRAAHTPIGRRSGSKCKNCMYDQDAWIKEMGDCPHKTSAPLVRCWLFSGIFSPSSFGKVLSIKHVLHRIGWSIAALESSAAWGANWYQLTQQFLAVLSSLFRFFSRSAPLLFCYSLVGIVSCCSRQQLSTKKEYTVHLPVQCQTADKISNKLVNILELWAAKVPGISFKSCWKEQKEEWILDPVHQIARNMISNKCLVSLPCVC